MRANGSSRRDSVTRAPISPQVAALRRRVWTVRIACVLAVVVAAWGYTQIMSMRSASLRRPDVALAASSQLFGDITGWLSSHSGQLLAEATAAQFRGVKAGPLSPATTSVQFQSGRWYVRASNTISLSAVGEPVATPIHITVADHRLDSRGLVAEVTLEATYAVCWDRSAAQPRLLADGEQMPRPKPGEVVAGNLPRYSEAYSVVDRLVVTMNHRTLRWVPSAVERVHQTVLH